MAGIDPTGVKKVVLVVDAVEEPNIFFERYVMLENLDVLPDNLTDLNIVSEEKSVVVDAAPGIVVGPKS
jgi:hypothetical protein